MRILITAGPTREPIDPVRFITNYSTGAMGYAIARRAKDKRHKVELTSGPTHLAPPRGVKTTLVSTADDMFRAVKARFKRCDCLVMSAAISDFKPAVYSESKTKRASSPKAIRLVSNKDILRWAGERKGKRVLVGFCMETENLLRNAKKKMVAKHLDMIVANKIDARKSAFGRGKTSVFILGPGSEEERLVDVAKETIARILLDKIEALWYKK